MANRLAVWPRYGKILYEHVTLADHVRLDRQMFVHPPLVKRVGIEQAGLRIERGVRPVLGPTRRGPMLDGLAGPQFLSELGLDRTAALQVHVRRPGELLVRLRRDQSAVGAVEHIEETVAVELHDDLALYPAHVDVGED